MLPQTICSLYWLVQTVSFDIEFLLFLIFFMCMEGYVHINIPKVQKILNSLKLELQIVMCCLTWVLAIKLRPSGRALNHWLLSPVGQIGFSTLPLVVMYLAYNALNPSTSLSKLLQYFSKWMEMDSIWYMSHCCGLSHKLGSVKAVGWRNWACLWCLLSLNSPSFTSSQSQCYILECKFPLAQCLQLQLTEFYQVRVNSFVFNQDPATSLKFIYLTCLILGVLPASSQILTQRLIINYEILALA